MPTPFPPLTARLIEWARVWIARGFRPVPLIPRKKKPTDDDWPLTDFSEDLPRYFSQGKNLGVMLGEPHGNTDIDLDCQEAIRIWPEFAPLTNMRWGRSSKPNSHWMYRSSPPARKVAFEDTIEESGKPKKVTLLEMRGLKKNFAVGFQTMAPPSIHPDTGERVRFEPGADGDPGTWIYPISSRQPTVALLRRSSCATFQANKAVATIRSWLWQACYSAPVGRNRLQCSSPALCTAVYGVRKPTSRPPQAK
jgi:hypothetical protein